MIRVSQRMTLPLTQNLQPESCNREPATDQFRAMRAAGHLFASKPRRPLRGP